MNIFDNLDRLTRDVTIINEEEKKTEIEINPDCETAEQARVAIRRMFASHYFPKPKSPKSPEDDGWPEAPKEAEPELPDPFEDDAKAGKGKDTSFKDDVKWEDDEMDELKDDASKLEGEDFDDEEEDDDKDNDLFDDFDEDKSDSGDGDDDNEGSGEDGEEEEDSGDDDIDGEDGGDSGDDDKDGEEGKDSKGKSGEGKDGEDSGEAGEDMDGDGEEGKGEKDSTGKRGKSGKQDKGEPGDSKNDDHTDDGKGGDGGKWEKNELDKKDGDGYGDFKDELKKALDRASKLDGGDEKSSMDDLIDKMDKLEDMKDKNPSEKMKELKKAIDEKTVTPSAPVGSMMGETSDEDLKKELEEHGYSSDDIKANTDAKNAKTPIPTEKEEKMREEAMKGFEKRSKGASTISKSIMYKALKNREFTEGVWDELIEKIIRSKSKRSGKEDNKHKEIRLGSKTHLWRGAVLPTYKVEKGLDKKKIYCFVDWSGSVTGVDGLIESFIGKVIHVSEKLDYEDMDVYGFGDRLSLPRTITREMREDDGLEAILADTRSYMDSQHLGGSIENFNAVAHEINRIKSKDEEGIIFIFGDGIWTFYGNSQPPVRLREVCPEYREDIYAFIFYNKEYRTYTDYWDYVLHEVAAVVDNTGAGLGSDHVILAPIEDISK